MAHDQPDILNMAPYLAVVIPCLNEAENLRQLLPQLSNREELEVIVADGGSTDGSSRVAESFGVRVMQSPRGRGRQMNYGVRGTDCTNLLFLHADTRLPDNFPTLVKSSLQQNGVAGGAFSLGTDRHTLAMRLICFGANLRSRLFHLPYGDQAIFTTRINFETVGCYPEIEIMEDYVFIRRLGGLGRIVILNETAVTSARRWENFGLLRTTLINQLMVLGFRVGIAPSKLARFYRRAKTLEKKME